MLTRYWQWTSGAATPATSSLPFGPLRWRAWTSQAADAAVAGLPFGPLRFRAWTSGAAEPPPPDGGVFGGGAVRLRVDPLIRLRLQRDDELVAFVAAAAAAAGLLNG